VDEMESLFIPSKSYDQTCIVSKFSFLHQDGINEFAKEL